MILLMNFEVFGGEGGIRTPDRLAPMPHFECGAFNHSATSPRRHSAIGSPAVGPCSRRGSLARQGAMGKNSPGLKPFASDRIRTETASNACFDALSSQRPSPKRYRHREGNSHGAFDGSGK